MDFWKLLPRPFFALAPLDDVTDAAFRRLIAHYGKPASTRTDSSTRGGPDVMFTEFVSADGLVLAPQEREESVRRKLLFSEAERPIVAQLFTSSPERMEKAAQIVREFGFDGVDINMGCPDRSVEKSRCGAALMKNPQLARTLIRSALKAGLPVSVKTRIGYARNEIDTWIPQLLSEDLSAISIHARTRNELSDVPARWEAIARAVEIRDELGSKTLIIGNGDVRDMPDARLKAKTYLCDGIMLGRAIYGNPWLFASRKNTFLPTPKERLNALSEHLKLFNELLSGTTNYATMKKHFKAYVHGWPASGEQYGAKELRMRLMETENPEEAQHIIHDATYIH